MIVTISIVLLGCSTLYYVLFLGKVRNGLRRLLRRGSYDDKPLVSVLVAARNEERTIEACIRSVLDQDYPSNLIEIIVVNDASSDKTGTILRHIVKNNANVHVVTLEEFLGRKPLALSAAVKESRGEIILTTDADCIVPQTWISGMVRYFQPSIAFVAGPVGEREGPSTFSKLERLEFLGLITTAAGLIGANRPIICNGANLAYKKSAFLSVQGYGETDSWSDDETLMSRIQSRHVGTVTFAADSAVLVTTSSANTLRSFIRQRLRWSAKSGHYEDSTILLQLVAIYFYFLLLLTFVIGSFWAPAVLPWAVLSLLTKGCTEYLTLRAGGGIFRSDVPVIPFLIAEFFHVPYIVVTAAVGQFVSLEWKGRKII
jgi:cellulose synthase/poly-beta-1,6-N-acetylglucosamine synthase-like glycosyltransferase